MIEMSRMPASDRWSVRGIGVAERVSTSTSSRSDLSSSFCATPNRCSSSRITSPSSFGITSRLRTRCVPMRTSTLPAREVGEGRLGLLRRHEARDHLDANREVAEALAERVVVLLGEDRGRREQQHLAAVDGHGEGGTHGHLGLAEADVAAHEPVHRPRRLEVLLDRLDRSLLIRRLAIGEARFELWQPLAREVVRDSLARLALRIELDQVAGKLADRLARARLERLPRLAAELRERGRRSVGADVARDLAELLVRHVEPVLAAEGEQEVVARDAGDGVRLEAEQPADAVILVDDVVPRAEVGEGLQRAPAETTLTRHAPTEHLVVGQQDEAEVAPDEAAPRGRDGEEELGLLGQLVPRLEHSRLDPAEEVLRPQRLPAMREGDDDPLAGPQERGELALGLGEPAGGDGGPLRFERERLGLRERVKLGRPGQRGRVRDAVLLPDAAHVIRLEDEVGRPVERRHQVVGHLDDGFVTLVIRQVRLDEVGTPLGRRVQRRLRDRMESALREGREGAHRLDLVAEELDAQRLAPRGREDVDDAAAHGELAAVVDALHALVAREGERLPESLDAGLEGGAQLDRLRASVLRRQPFGQRPRRRADEATAREHVQRSRPLADEVRWRREPRLAR